MLLHRLYRAPLGRVSLFRHGVAFNARSFYGRTASQRASRKLTGSAAAVGLFAASWTIFRNPTSPEEQRAIPVSSPDIPVAGGEVNGSASLARTPFGTLLRSYLVYTSLSIPFVVDYAPSVLSVLSSIPVVSSITMYCVRNTFFAQFVGGETAEDVIPLMRLLRQQKKASILTYNIEVDEGAEGDASWSRNVKETKRSIDVMGDFRDEVGEPGDAVVAIKLTALLPRAQSLKSFSQCLLSNRSTSNIPYPGSPEKSDVAILTGETSVHDGISQADINDVRRMYQDCREICSNAARRGVRVLIDAEHTWYQPTLDVITLALMQEFNTSSSWHTPPQVIVYGTFQAYLRRNPEHLQSQLQLAKAGGFALGVKLVRGAYHPQELEHAASGGQPAPVWPTKEETDACYNSSARVVLQDIAKGKTGTAAVFGTHNRESSEGILQGMVEQGLAEKDLTGWLKVKDGIEKRVAIAQLYGMHDDLSDSLSERLLAKTPMVLKCIPYGTLEEVIPYLGRRAIENKSVLGGKGGALHERRRMGDELWRRMKSWLML